MSKRRTGSARGFSVANGALRVVSRNNGRVQCIAFITGGSGFIGGAIIEQLRSEFRFRAMARSNEAAEIVAARGAEPVRCSLSNVTPAHIGEAIVAIHCAALVAEWARPGAFFETNVIGTDRLLRTARAAGVRKLVHLSTDSVLFTGRPLRGVDESEPMPTNSPFEYAATKAIAERHVVEANAPGEFETVVIRPTFVWGPGDTTILPEIRALVEDGRFLWIGGGEHVISTTHIKNLVLGVAHAVRGGGGGEVFFITDETPQQLRSFLTRYAATDGILLGNRSVPVLTVKIASFLTESAWKWLRPTARPPLTRFAVASLGTDYWIMSDKANRLLGYVPAISIDAGLGELQKLKAV
ncbi:MAG: NAD-dependent epimerase/dehydratase family protein [Acidimicrobiia bacterium]